MILQMLMPLAGRLRVARLRRPTVALVLRAEVSLCTWIKSNCQMSFYFALRPTASVFISLIAVSLTHYQLHSKSTPQNVSTNKTLGKTHEDKTLTKLPIVHGKNLISKCSKFSCIFTSRFISPTPRGLSKIVVFMGEEKTVQGIATPASRTNRFGSRIKPHSRPDRKPHDF